MKKKAILLASTLVVVIMGALLIKMFTDKEEQSSALPIEISEQRLHQLLHQHDLREVNLVYEKNLVYATLTQEALTKSEYRTELEDRGLLSQTEGPHYQVRIDSAPIFHENFATTLNNLPGSESVLYYVGDEPPLTAEEERSVPIDLRLVPLLFWGGTALWSVAVYGLIPFLAIYLLILGIRRLRKPLTKTMPPLVSQQGNGHDSSSTVPYNFPLKLGDRVAFIPIEEIACFFAQDNHVYLYDIEGKEHLVDYTLTDLESKLPSQFIRVHRSCIINCHLIREIKKRPGSRFAITLRDEQHKEIVTGQSYASPVKQLFEI